MKQQQLPLADIPQDVSVWHQISGDVGAAQYGATFGRAVADGYQVVEIVNMEVAAGERGYTVWGAEYGVRALHTEEAELAKTACRMPADFPWDGEAVYQALFQYGYRVEGVDAYDTLREAMDASEIPASALWCPSEYDKTVEWLY